MVVRDHSVGVGKVQASAMCGLGSHYLRHRLSLYCSCRVAGNVAQNYNHRVQALRHVGRGHGSLFN